MLFAFNQRLNFHYWHPIFLSPLAPLINLLIFQVLPVSPIYQHQQNQQRSFHCRSMVPHHISIIQVRYSVIVKEYRTLLHLRFIIGFALLSFILLLFCSSQLLQVVSQYYHVFGAQLHTGLKHNWLRLS